jgi:lambda family phage portal protein
MVSLRDHARDLVRNTPMARVPDVLAAHIVGTGIIPVSRTGNRALDKKVNALFDQWSEQCLVSGELDFYGAQNLVLRSVVEGGDAFVRFLLRDSKSTLAVPLQLRLMEGDQIDESKHGSSTRGQDHSTTLGVEFDADGARTGYWVRKVHPGEPHSFRGLESTFVDARDMAHVYRPLRIGQARGVTWFAPVLLTARDLADYLEASLVKARTEACFAGFVKSNDPGMPGNIASAASAAKEKATSNRDRELELSPGMITRLEDGEDIVFAQPSASNSFEAYVLHASMAVAAGVTLTYDQLTGDLRQANYSSLRAGKIEFRGIVRQLQHRMMIRQFCKPVWHRFIEAAVLAGKLPQRVSGYPSSWIAPGFEPIDPLKDLKADILAVRAGRSTWDEFVAEWGNDPQTQMDEIQRINKDFDERGLILDIDPRKMTSSGQTQSSEQGKGDRK